MPLVIMLAAAGVIGIGIGVKGLLGSGVQLTRTKTIGGASGKVVAGICLIFGLASGVVATLLMWLISFRT